MNTIVKSAIESNPEEDQKMSRRAAQPEYNMTFWLICGVLAIAINIVDQFQ